MSANISIPPDVQRLLTKKTPFLWLNDAWQSTTEACAAGPHNLNDVYDAELRLKRFSGLLVKLFPEVAPSHGIIESPLYSADALQLAMPGGYRSVGRWLIKGDHALPIAGSIKARGGFYEVLLHAENLALLNGLLKPSDNRLIMASPEARALFAKHHITVGSTGNLGLSIGVMAAALGFRAIVHMSAGAKAWKKARLRACGVDVVEHLGDFGEVVATGREQARSIPNTYFVDDEHSRHLFLGYSVAAVRLQQQLKEQGVKVDSQHPLFVYLPCGVGGAPGGITFGLRHLFGDNVHCFFAEPVASPSMLIRLASSEDQSISVRELGLDNCTEADGLAVGQASDFVAPLMRPLVSGAFTLSDDDLFESLFLLEQAEGLRIEPSAAAGFRGPSWILESPQGQRYQARHNLSGCMKDAMHILWTTGGALVPEEEYRKFHERGRRSVQSALRRQPSDATLASKV